MNLLKTMNRMLLLHGRKADSVRAFKFSLVACFDQSWPQVAVAALSFLEFLGVSWTDRGATSRYCNSRHGAIGRNTIEKRHNRSKIVTPPTGQ